MKKLFDFLAEHIRLLNKSIYRGEKYEKNLSALLFLGIVTAVFGVIMTVLNIVQKKGFVTYTTIMFTICGMIIAISGKVLRKREIAVVTTVVLCAFIFTYYAIGGVNDGFAILWTFLMPLAICYFLSVKYGIILSFYFELLIIVLFYTPLRSNFTGAYTETFMTRFPIIYLCGVLTTLISMSQYHESILFELEYTDRLNKEVERQTHVATERAEQLQKLSDQTVLALARTIDAKDKYTNGHSFRVSDYSVALAKRLGWSEAEVNEMRRESLLHDIGKIGIPDAVLNKPGRLDNEEFETIKSHTVIGKNILEGLEDMSGIANVALYHHERYDGKGYPTGLSGSDIPLHARIVAIADAYDAMNSDRIYRPALSRDKIRKEFDRCTGTQFDPELIAVFKEIFDEGIV